MGGTRRHRLSLDQIMIVADQAPELADIRKAGHEGGDFLFIRNPSSGGEGR